MSSFSSLLSGYAKSKSEPSVEVQKVPAAPKPHPLKAVLTNIRSELAPIVSANQISTTERNLGILVTIIDDFPNELLWRLWLDTANAENSPEEKPKVRMWFHAKCPEKVRSPWVKARLIRSAHFKPEWGSIEITKAMAHMLHEALFDAPHINKFCFASESCIPIRSLVDTLDILYSANVDCLNNTDGGSNSSWLNYSDIPNNGYAKQLQHDPLSRALPDGCVFKASQWVLLSRAHAVAVIDLMQRVGRTSAYTSSEKQNSTASASETLPALSNTLFSAFELVGKASDEMFFPSCLAIVGAIQPSSMEGHNSTSNNDTPAGTITNSVFKQQVTYCDWTDNAKSPQEYSLFPTALVTALTHYKDYTATVKSKKQLETQRIHPEQQYACFLRKIKFPMKYVGAKSDKEGLNEPHTRFLLDWLPSVVSERGADRTNESIKESEISEVAVAIDDTKVHETSDLTVAACGDKSLMDRYMQRALDLYRIIASYPAPERVIKKRPLVEEDADFSRSNSYNNNNDRYSGGYDDRNNREDRHSRYNNDYGAGQGSNDNRNHGYYDNHRGSNAQQYHGGNRQDGDRYGDYRNDRNNRDDRNNYSNKSGRYY
eukprot:gene10025-11750_t